MMAFQKIDIKDLDMNVFQTIGQDWMLITAGDQQKINTMTASWGGMGVFWGENVVHAYIRPQRYTKQFVDQQPCFSLSFFDGYKKETACSQKGWNNKMFVASNLMPHQICITKVRIEKLQDISDEDCLAEGIIKKWHAPAGRNYYYVPNVEVKSKKDAYNTPTDRDA